jgi:ketopantoate reductase
VAVRRTWATTFDSSLDVEANWFAGAVVKRAADRGIPVPCCRAIADILALPAFGAAFV